MFATLSENEICRVWCYNFDHIEFFVFLDIIFYKLQDFYNEDVIHFLSDCNTASMHPYLQCFFC